MKTIELTILAVEGPETVTAEEIEPGLYVHELPDNVSVGSPCRWRITHHSGHGIAAAPLKEHAVAGARIAARYGDWTQDPATLRDSVDTVLMFDELSWANCIHPAL